jgi:hypothetical protein
MKYLLPVLLALTLPCLYADEARGKAIYAQLCFNCHGPNLDGGIGPALNDNYWRHGSSPQAILDVITKGVPETEMIAYEAVYSEADRIALRDFILSEQEGLREVVRGVYPRAYFKGKRLTPALFDSVESESQTALPENVFYFGRSQDGLLRGAAKLYIKEAGKYHFSIRPLGRTSLYLNGKEVHYSDDKAPKNTHFNEALELTRGTHDLEILHEEKTTHSWRFYGVLQKVGGHRLPLVGRSLEGNVPKVIKPGPEAQVARKWIAGLPPRTLLCVLPNKVIVAYNPVDGKVLKAWHSAEINQTPSLTDRSAKPSEISGTPIPELAAGIPNPQSLQFLHYETEGNSVHIVSVVDGRQKTLTIAPKGAQSFAASLK